MTSNQSKQGKADTSAQDVVTQDVVTQDVVTQWCLAGERGDAEAAAAMLAPDVELISPLTEQFRFRGPEQVGELLAAAFTTVSDIQFHTRVGEAGTHAVFYHGRVGRQSVEEAQLLRVNTEALIHEITLFGRPLPALTGVMATLGPKLVRQQGRNGLAAFLAVGTAAFDGMARLSERRVVPLAAPND